MENQNIRKRIEKNEDVTLSHGWATFSAGANNTRYIKEDEDDIRAAFQRDRDRIIHCEAYRRLKAKTQVFLAPVGDMYRTRMTHTTEVSQIARTIARALQLNEDLTEAIALGHDLGHAPFGHAGEAVLNKLCMEGFAHYEQSVRVVDCLEKDGKGLNLTYAVRDGIMNHTKGEWAHTPEGCIVRYADQIAFLGHDVEDSVRAGVLNEENIPKEYSLVLGNTKSERITTMVDSLISHSYPTAVCENTCGICMEDAVYETFKNFRSWMYQNVYTNPKAKGEESKVAKLLTDIFNHYVLEWETLPTMYVNMVKKETAQPLENRINRVVTDYVSGMTDNFAIEEYQRLFVPQRWSVL